MDPFHGEVAEAGCPEGATVAHAVVEDPPREERRVLVLPNRAKHFTIIVGFREAHPEGDRAHALDGSTSPFGCHAVGKRLRLIFVISRSAAAAPLHGGNASGRRGYRAHPRRRRVAPLRRTESLGGV